MKIIEGAKVSVDGGKVTVSGAKGTLVPADPPFTRARSGAGPRHIAFHPRLPYAWVINELAKRLGA